MLGQERVSYSQLEDRVAGVAGGLHAAGVGPGDRVAAALKNRLEFIELFFAVARLGAIFVPLNFRLSAEEVGYAVTDSGAKLVVAQEATRRAVLGALAARDADLPVLFVDGDDGRFDAWRAGPPHGEIASVEAEDPVSIVYTSGTTGPAKGAVLTHGSVLAAVLALMIDWDLHRDDVTLVCNPIFHVILYVTVVPVLFKGGTAVLMEDFDPELAVQLAVRERITFWFSIPTSWQMVLESRAMLNADLPALRFVASGGAACPGPVMDRFAELGWPYRQGYGLSETTGAATTMRPEDQALHRGAVGLPFFNVEVRIVDQDGVDLARGEAGEVLLRGATVCSGYWQKPVETADAFAPDGWFRTGDIGTLTAEGILRIVDRKKDLIISGGENISSIEVEQAVVSHPQVLEASVIGVADERWGETPCAVVVLTLGTTLDPQAIIDHCRAKLAHYKCPTSVVAVSELPKTATGKISKVDVRKLVADRGSTRPLA